jgi:hypothetical protein
VHTLSIALRKPAKKSYRQSCRSKTAAVHLRLLYNIHKFGISASQDLHKSHIRNLKSQCSSLYKSKLRLGHFILKTLLLQRSLTSKKLWYLPDNSHISYSHDKICMMMTRLACNWAIESSYWRMDNDPDIGLLTGYVLYWLPVELEFMDLDTFPRWFGLHPSLLTSW